jgi:hypothetical protein
VDGEELLFLPRYPFVPGTDYEVSFDGAVRRVLRLPDARRNATAEVWCRSIRRRRASL